MKELTEEQIAQLPQEKAEKYYKKQGWNIIYPTLTRDRANCKHEWEKIKKDDWQCQKCLQGYLGNPNKI